MGQHTGNTNPTEYISENTRIGITGHRVLPDPAGIREKLREQLNHLWQKHPAATAYSALATGTDTIFAEEASRFSMPLKVVLPFAIEEYEKGLASEDKKILEDLIKRSVDPPEFISTRIPKDSHEKNKYYLEAGKKIVDDCDIILAVWDGKPSNGTGGTAEIVAYAQKKKKELHIIFVKRDHVLASPDLEGIYIQKDEKAIKARNSFNWYWSWGIRFSFLAIFVIGLNNSFGHHTPRLDFFTIAAESLLIGAAYFFLVKKARKIKDERINTRRDAERVKYLKQYIDAGIPPEKIILNSNDLYQVDETIATIENRYITQQPPVTDFSNVKTVLITILDNQVAYHTVTRINVFKRSLKNYVIVLRIIFCSFFINLGLEFMYYLDKAYLHWHIPGIYLESIHPFLLLFAIILPPLYATIEGWIYFKDWKKGIAFSEDMCNRLSILRSAVNDASSTERLHELSHQIRTLLDKENSKWAIQMHSMEVSFKP